MKIIVGIDEAGRGCWAGPLVAAAVILTKPINGLADSKQLTSKRRTELAQIIKGTCAFGIGWIDPKEVDEVGLTMATAKAMKMALDQITAEFDEIIIDGNFNYLPEESNVSVLPKADFLIPAVSAASIIAKVERDSYMREVANQFPLYQFERHVGYGTALHHQLLKLHGPCAIHRLSYKPLQDLLKVADV